jgi:hypothetical protein
MVGKPIAAAIGVEISKNWEFPASLREVLTADRYIAENPLGPFCYLTEANCQYSKRLPTNTTPRTIPFG